jgi:signal transduction histidine kinase
MIALIQPLAASRSIRLTSDVHGCYSYVMTDRQRARQVLLNLLSNAVKFTPSGGRITVSCAATETSVELVVRDTGIGISVDKLEAIFEPFVQVGRSLVTSHEGTGLGLPISRNLARAMGGELTVESTPGQGSVFRLTLRRAG